MKKTKKFKYLFWLILAFLIGFFVAHLHFTGIFWKLEQGFDKLNWYHTIIIFFSAFYLALIVHEVAHLLVFVFCKKPIRAIYITGFCFYKKCSKWRFKIVPAMFLMVGGMVVPNIEINNENDFLKFKKIIMKSIIAAPICTICFFVLVLIANILFLWYSHAYLFLAILFLFSLFLSLFTILFTIVSKMSKNNMYGDFIAYKKLKNDDLFYLSFLINYDKFSDFENDYILQVIVKYLKDNQVKNHLYYEAWNYYFLKCLFNNEPVDQELNVKVNYFSYMSLLNENNIEVLVNYLAYCYQYIDANTALTAYAKIKYNISLINQNSVNLLEYFFSISKELINKKDFDLVSKVTNFLETKKNNLYVLNPKIIQAPQGE